MNSLRHRLPSTVAMSSFQVGDHLTVRLPVPVTDRELLFLSGLSVLQIHKPYNAPTTGQQSTG